VREHEGGLLLVGPIGAQFRIGTEEFVLSAEDSVSPTDERFRRDFVLRGLARLGAMKSVPFRREALFEGDLRGICLEARGSISRSIPVRVTLPDLGTPIEGEWEFRDDALRTQLNAHLSAARRGEVTLPELTGEGVVAGGGCHGNVGTLADIRYVAEVEVRTRRKGCGRYRSESGQQETYYIYFDDEVISLYDVRANERVGRTTLRPPNRDCPSSIRPGTAGQTVDVTPRDVRAWVRTTLQD
jgi:hypothetical protein